MENTSPVGESIENNTGLHASQFPFVYGVDSGRIEEKPQSLVRREQKKETKHSVKLNCLFPLRFQIVRIK